MKLRQTSHGDLTDKLRGMILNKKRIQKKDGKRKEAKGGGGEEEKSKETKKRPRSRSSGLSVRPDAE